MVTPAGEEWLVDRILDSKVMRNRLEFLVQWSNSDENNCEPFDNVCDTAALEEFFKDYPGKPGYNRWKDFMDNTTDRDDEDFTAEDGGGDTEAD